MTDHVKLTMATQIKIYFRDPQLPWQRGGNENTNPLLRQYFPGGLDLSNYSQTTRRTAARQLNEHPRRTLQYETPAETFGQCVATIH